MQELSDQVSDLKAQQSALHGEQARLEDACQMLDNELKKVSQPKITNSLFLNQDLHCISYNTWDSFLTAYCRCWGNSLITNLITKGPKSESCLLVVQLTDTSTNFLAILLSLFARYDFPMPVQAACVLGLLVFPFYTCTAPIGGSSQVPAWYDIWEPDCNILPL